MSKNLKYYYDLMSQPSRALWIFLEKTKLPYEKCLINLGKGMAGHRANVGCDTLAHSIAYLFPCFLFPNPPKESI